MNEILWKIQYTLSPVKDVLTLAVMIFLYCSPILIIFLTNRYQAKHISTDGVEIKNIKRSVVFELIGLGWSLILMYFVMELLNECTFREWQEQLMNAQTHTPISMPYFPTIATLIVIALLAYIVLNLVEINKMPPLIIVICISGMYIGTVVMPYFPTIATLIVIALLAYIVLNLVEINKMPPLIIVICISGMYIGTVVMIVWSVQTKLLYAWMVDICWIGMLVRTMLLVIKTWGDNEYIEKVENSNTKYKKLKLLIANSNNWPIVGLIAMIPLLGIIIAFLVLFGQEPDAIIKAWTNTSDWVLSQQTSLPNLVVDEHYLCTVAAGGHEKIVKPQRKGIRHGHEVVVNRQLCIANAFEDVIMEKTPTFHRYLRGFYDKYGFPVARLIKTKGVADVVYFIMKPLEWIFLIVLYMVDVNPENRIAVQYTGKNVRDFEIE